MDRTKNPEILAMAWIHKRRSVFIRFPLIFKIFCINKSIFLPLSSVVNAYIIECLHLVFLILPIVPAVPSLWHQQGDDVALSKAQKGAIVASGVGENGLYTRTSVLLQTGRHGT